MTAPRIVARGLPSTLGCEVAGGWAAERQHEAAETTDVKEQKRSKCNLLTLPYQLGSVDNSHRQPEKCASQRYDALIISSQLVVSDGNGTIVLESGDLS